MNEYLLGGLAVALLVLLLVVRLLRRRRPAARSPRGRAPVDAVDPLARSGAELDTISDVHELPSTQPATGGERPPHVAHDTAELATRAEAARTDADREAAEWEARLLAQQLAHDGRAQDHQAVVLTPEPAADLVSPPELVVEPEPGPQAGPKSAFDEQAMLDALAREAAEWEARLAAQQLADAERQADEAAAQAQRVAEEQAAQAQAEQRAALHAQQLEAERQAQEAAARALAEQLAQAEAAARQAAAAPPRALEVDVAPEALVAPSGAAVRPPESVSRAPEQCLVMVVDDSKVVRVKTSRLLAKHAYRVVLAEDGLDALRQIAEEQPNVLITDVEMPHMDGFALTRQLRGDPRTAHIPIVMITADDMKHRAEALDAGVSVLLSKPYPEDGLLSYLQSTLEALAPAH